MERGTVQDADPAARRPGAGQPGREGTPPPAGPGETVGGLIELQTGAVAAGGGCVARAADGRVVFVRHSLPGERVLARITAETSSFLRADAVEVLEASPDRVEPPCTFAGPGGCGGCDWQHVALPAQRAWKAALVSEQLRRLAGVDRPVEVAEVPGAPDGLGWRTRVRFAADRSGRLGFRGHRSHAVRHVDRCLIASPAIEEVGVERLRWPGAAEVEVLATPDGSRRTVLVTSPRRRRLGAMPAVDAGLVVDGQVRRAPGRIEVDVLGRSFGVSAGSFWQVHTGAPAVLVRAVLEGLDARAGERALDLYAGAGLFAAFVADAVGPGGSVVAVERDRRAGADAARNTAGQPHVEVRVCDVTPELIATGAGRPDLIVLDPAREGAGRAVMAAIAGLDPPPRRVVYVSCDPASLARDLRVALDAGWRLGSLAAFDLFPMTEHVEIVSVLEPGA